MEKIQDVDQFVSGIKWEYPLAGWFNEVATVSVDCQLYNLILCNTYITHRVDTITY